MEKNILSDSSAAPALQEKQRQLEMHMRTFSPGGYLGLVSRQC